MHARNSPKFLVFGLHRIEAAFLDVQAREKSAGTLFPAWLGNK